MFVFLESADGLTAHTLGGRIWLGQFRMGRFQLFQFPEQTVIFKIRHTGIIQHIITVIGLHQKGGQLPDSFLRFHIILRFVKMFGVPHQR